MAKNDKATEGTYSAKPFITRDGVDEDGNRAEVKVVMGYGDVIEIEDSKGGKSKKIVFAVSNSEWNSAGWTRSSALQELAEKAKETGEPIHFRIETRRKDDVDRLKPFSELDATRGAEIVKSLAALKLEGDEKWTISQDAVTIFEEDPRTSGGLIKATPEDMNNSKANGRNESSGNSRNGSFEPAPYVAVWNGAINPGAIAVNAPLGFLGNLKELERETGVSIEPDQLKSIAKTLLRIANQLQKDIYVKHLEAEYTGVDLTAGSHTRARALIFETLRSYAPLTEDILADEEELKRWQRKVYNTAYAMWVWALETVDEYVS